MQEHRSTRKKRRRRDAARFKTNHRRNELTANFIPLESSWVPFSFPNFGLTAPSPAGDNDLMSTETAASDPVADSEHADTEAVLRHAFKRAPLDPEVARRVDERAARITEQVRRTHGVIDDETFQALLAEDES